MGAEMTKIKVNGTVHELNDVSEDTPLLWVLRDHLGLTGTKYGCGVSECGACTVHIDGEAVQSCVTDLSEVGDSEVTTIEGLSEDGSHPVQKAWKEFGVPQCGYCQVGQIMMAAAMLKSNSAPTDEDIEREMWNICRCGTYPRIRAAVKAAAQEINQ
jgi:isoquinoline 1-oxidoreductase alpha subunit